MDEKRPAGTTETAQPFADEVERPEDNGAAPTPDDKGDPKREAEARKTTQRQE